MNLIAKIEKKLSEKIVSKNSVGGGCIANAFIIITETGKNYFIKSYGNNKDILRNESNGLKELAKTNAIRVPEVIALDKEFIILEFIEQGKRKKNFSSDFGNRFARMHKFSGESFGFFENNYIGSTPQINRPENENWKDFFWQNRLLYQYKLAEHNHFVDSELKKSFTKLEHTFFSLINGTEEPPTILHGDLWGGNYLVDHTGNAVLIDPAVYYGHREADLAMTKMFGGFDSEFYKSYHEEFPLIDDWEYRLDIYMLYHVLNHLNLFGLGYYSQALSIIKKYI